MRKMLMASLAVIATIATAGVVMAGETHELDCKCEPGEGSSGEIAHYYPFDASGTRAYRCGPGGCHNNLFANTCSAEHEGCGSNFVFDSTEEAHDLRPGVLKLAARADVVLNGRRNALQILGCNGQLVGHVAISQAERDAVMAIRLALAL